MTIKCQCLDGLLGTLKLVKIILNQQQFCNWCYGINKHPKNTTCSFWKLRQKGEKWNFNEWIQEDKKWQGGNGNCKPGRHLIASVVPDEIKILGNYPKQKSNATETPNCDGNSFYALSSYLFENAVVSRCPSLNMMKTAAHLYIAMVPLV